MRTIGLPSATQRLLIIGASGFLGRWIASFARERWQVLGTYFRHPLSVPGVPSHPLDVCDAQAVHTLCHSWQPHVIVHAAVHIGDPDRMWTVIVEGTRHVAKAAASIRARLLYISTDLVFDGEKGWYTEGDPPSPRLPYGQAKKAAEDIVRATVEAAVILRPSLLCHLDPPDPRTARVLAAARGQTDMAFFVDEFRTPAWVTDVARAVVELLDLPFTGTLHLAGPQRMSRYELAIRLARAWGLDPASLRPGCRQEVAPNRPRDTSLVTTKARQLLKTRLHSIEEGLANPQVSRAPDPTQTSNEQP